jgi:hypothetical protein
MYVVQRLKQRTTRNTVGLSFYARGPHTPPGSITRGLLRGSTWFPLIVLGPPGLRVVCPMAGRPSSGRPRHVHGLRGGRGGPPAPHAPLSPAHRSGPTTVLGRVSWPRPFPGGATRHGPRPTTSLQSVRPSGSSPGVGSRAAKHRRRHPPPGSACQAVGGRGATPVRHFRRGVFRSGARLFREKHAAPGGRPKRSIRRARSLRSSSSPAGPPRACRRSAAVDASLPPRRYAPHPPQVFFVFSPRNPQKPQQAGANTRARPPPKKRIYKA